MKLTQTGDEIRFGDGEFVETLSTSRTRHFTREDVAQSEAYLIANLPGQEGEIRRLADRLRRML